MISRVAGMVYGSPFSGFTRTFGFLNSGKIFRDGIFEKEGAFFVQHHDRNAGDGLAHGTDAEHGIEAHGLASLAIHFALRLEPCGMAAAYHQCDRSGEPFVIDVTLDNCADPFQPLRRQSQALGLCDSQLLRDRPRGSRDKARTLI